MTRNILRGFSPIDVIAVVSLGALLIGTLPPSLSRSRELSRRLTCSVNLKGIGASAKIYAEANNDRWMIPPFKAGVIDSEGVDYINGRLSSTPPPTDPGEVGYERHIETTSETKGDPNGGSRVCSVTRSFWLLVRSGDVTVQQFICPSSGDQINEGENPNLYYDFAEYKNISYGYRVPFGPRDTQPREGADNRLAFATDKSPFYLSRPAPDFLTAGHRGGPITLNDSLRAWRRFNSPNHGGSGNGEGQNCLYADGHTAFQRLPAVGADNDNIYTVMSADWNLTGFNRIHGDTVWISPNENPYPGQDAFGTGPNNYASTDSLIYP